MLIREEIKNVYRNQKVWIALIVSLIFLSFFQLLNYEYKTNTGYEQLIETLKSEDITENIQILQRKLVEIKILIRFVNNEIREDERDEFEARYGSLLQDYSHGNYILYTKDVFTEYDLYMSVLYDNLNIANYHSTRQEKINQIENKLQSPIFQNYSDLLTLNNELPYLRKLTSVKIGYFVNDTRIERFLNTTFSSWLLILNMIIFLSVLILEDKKYHLTDLFKTTQKGRSIHFLTKLLTFILGFILYAVLFFSIDLIFAAINSVQLNIPIQNVKGYLDVYMILNVLTYWIVSTLLRLTIIFSYLMLIFCLFILIENTMIAYALVGVFAVIKYLFSILITPNSKFLFLKQLSVFQLINMQNVLGQFQYVVYGNWLIFYLNAVIWGSICITLLCLLIAWLTYIRIQRTKIIKHFPQLAFPVISKGLFWLETDKLLGMNKAMFLFILLVFFQIQYFSTYKGPVEPNAYGYSTYLKPFKGPINQDLYLQLEHEEDRFHDYRLKQDELTQALEAGALAIYDFNPQYYSLKAKLIDEIYYNQFLNELPSMENYGYVFDTTGYKHYFSLKSDTLSILYYLMCCISIIILSLLLFSTDYFYQTRELILSTIKRKKYSFILWSILSIGILIVISIIYLPQFVMLNKYLTITDFNAPFKAIFGNGLNLSIGMVYTLLILNRFLVFIFYSSLTSILLKFIDRNVVFFVLIGFIGLDLIFYQFNFKYISFFYFISIQSFFDSSLLFVIRFCFVLLITFLMTMYANKQLVRIHK